MTRRFREALRSGDRRQLEHLADSVAIKFHLRAHLRLHGGRERTRSLYQRRGVVLAHLREVLDARLAGRQPPPSPHTGSDEVDRSLAALVEAIQAHYEPLEQAA
jgi:hypothetical protein